MKIKLENMRTINPIKKFALMSVLFLAIKDEALAQNTTASITLSALVNEIISMSITPAGNYSNLNVSETQVDTLVATIYETSNSSNGYLVKARSENSGKIQSTKGADSVPYYMRYAGGGALKLSTSDQTVREQTLGGIYNSSNKSVTISFQGVPVTSLGSGIYKDTITFTIESK
jgi:hypothetical protein